MKALSWKICVLLQRRCNFEVFLRRVVWGFAKGFFLFCLRDGQQKCQVSWAFARMLLEHEGDYGLGMDVMVTLCAWSRARRRSWFGHGCKGNRMLLQHEGDDNLGMDVKGTVCSRSTKEIMVWAWMQR